MKPSRKHMNRREVLRVASGAVAGWGWVRWAGAADMPQVKCPRATSGDLAVEPDWEQRLVISVGPRGADLAGESEKPIQAAADYLARLGQIGIQAGPDQLYTSTMATIEYLREQMPQVRRLFVLGTASMRREMEAAGFPDRNTGMGDVETFLMGGDGEDVPRGDLSFPVSYFLLGENMTGKGGDLRLYFLQLAVRGLVLEGRVKFPVLCHEINVAIM